MRVMSAQLYISIYKKGGCRSLRHHDRRFIFTLNMTSSESSQISFLTLFMSYTESINGLIGVIVGAVVVYTLNITYEH